jgi:polyisoprenoid-binding protein YceI
MTVETHSLTRTVDNKVLPAAGEWQIDPAHTSVEFIGRHLMVTKVRGSFAEVSGTITVGDDPLDSTVSVTIGTASVSTGSEERDAHLVSGDFFAVDSYPDMRFVSTGIRPNGDAWVLDGELTIKDVTRPVSLDFEFSGIVDDPWGNSKAGFSASTEILREDWGLTWNVTLESGGVLVSKKIALEIEVQAALAS